MIVVFELMGYYHGKRKILGRHTCFPFIGRLLRHGLGLRALREDWLLELGHSFEPSSQKQSKAHSCSTWDTRHEVGRFGSMLLIIDLCLLEFAQRDK